MTGVIVTMDDIEISGSAYDSQLTVKREYKLSEAGKERLEEAAKCNHKYWVEGGEGKVTIIDKHNNDEVIKVFNSFLPTPKYSGPSNNERVWEYRICDILGETYTAIAKDLPFPKDRFKYYSDMLGCTPTKFISALNAIMLKTFISEDIMPVANKFCRGVKGRFNSDYIKRLNERKDLILGLLSSGMENMIPFFLYGEDEISISEFKEAVGEDLWNSLLSNSISRNKKIAYVNALYQRNPYTNTWAAHSAGEDERYKLEYLNSLPSGVISAASYRIPCKEEVELIKRFKVVSKPKLQFKVLYTCKICENLHSILDSAYPEDISSWGYDQLEDYKKELRLELDNRIAQTVDRLDSCNDTWSFYSALVDNKKIIDRQIYEVRKCMSDSRKRIAWLAINGYGSVSKLMTEDYCDQLDRLPLPVVDRIYKDLQEECFNKRT